MKPFHGGRVSLIAGDCLERMAELPANSFDAVITDPPYHFASIVKRFGDPDAAAARSNGATGVYARASRGFMGQQWDGGQIAHEPATWAAVLRVMKPGAHLVAFHAPKNWHRLACAIEDAGFEIRDTLLWVFGSGFPKSHNVGKAIDKSKGQGGYGRYKSERHADIVRIGQCIYDRPWMHDPEAVDRNAREWIPESNEAKQFNGFGTALKPAYEPIVLARKPIVGTVAANVMQYGTGALNIDACRVPGELGGDPNRFAKTDGGWGVKQFNEAPIVRAEGRWPANVCHDGSDEVVDGFPESDGQQRAVGPKNGPKDSVNAYGDYGPRDQFEPRGDSGSAARFFYTAKADADDRIGSKHPTVKPIDLMQWLVRLVTPSGGKILDPFAGTGTTAEAALREGFRCTLIERDPVYLADIERRMALVFEGDVTRSVAMAKLKPETTEPAPLLDLMRAAE